MIIIALTDTQAEVFYEMLLKCPLKNAEQKEVSGMVIRSIKDKIDSKKSNKNVTK